MEAVDSRLFLWLNGLHTEWLDKVMVSLTEMWPWIPIYILLLFAVIKHYRKQSLWVILALALMILCSDQLSAHVCKPLFQRLRPCYNPEFEGLLHLPKGMAGGRYGFVSSHAANTFAVAAFLTGVLKKDVPWIGWVLYAWAFISSYSRIYIGYHYPGDIIAGAILGLLIGLIFWYLLKLFLKHHLNHRADLKAPK